MKTFLKRVLEIRYQLSTSSLFIDIVSDAVLGFPSLVTKHSEPYLNQFCTRYAFIHRGTQDSRYQKRKSRGLPGIEPGSHPP